jgi:hypothetical protein
MMEKRCCKCKEIKPFNSFYKRKESKDGFRNDCKECRKSNQKKYYKENRDEIVIKARIQGKKYRMSEQGKLNRKKYWDRYYQENKDKVLSKNEKWRTNNKQKSRDYRKMYVKEKRKKDPLFRFRIYYSNNLNRYLKERTKKSNEILSCDKDWFFSKWIGRPLNENDEIDHIIPQSLGKTIKEIEALNHYSNLQLLHHKKNRQKGNRYISLAGLTKVLSNHPSPNTIKKIVSRSEIKMK